MKQATRKKSIKSLDSIMAQLSTSPTAQARPISTRSSVQLKTDVPLLMVIITLLIFGLVMVYSASYDYSLLWYENSSVIFYRQVAWFVSGILVTCVLIFLDYRLLKHVAVPAIAVTVLMLVGVIIQNNVFNGSARTLFGGSVQPSELAKIVTVIYLSVWLYAKRDKLSDISFGLIPLAAIVGLLSGLILIQTDISAAATILFLGGLMFFLAGGDLRQIGFLLVLAVIFGLIVVTVSSTGMERVLAWWTGLKNPLNSSYHVLRSLGAFINGGWLGLGIGNATSKVTGLPVPPTDSIFAVVGEETGVAGSIFLIGLYLVFLWRGLTIARRAPDDFGKLLAGGLTIWVSLEAFINMAGMVNIVPFPGNALPFISAGGSNLTMCLVAVGILLNISRLTFESNEQNGRLNNAVVDLRGRHRGRRLSSPQRPSRSGG